MSRRWLGLALLLSLGVNAGILATLAVERLRGGGRDHAAPVAEVAAEKGETPGPPEGPVAGPPAGPGAEQAPPPDGDEGSPARPDSQGFPPGMERRLGELASRMGLEGDRRARFLEIQRRFFRETRGDHDEGIDLHQSLRRELTSPEPSRDRLDEILEQLAATRRRLDQALVETVLATRELLGPEQEREYLTFLGRLRDVSEGRPPGGPPPRGPRRDGRPLRGPIRRPPPR